MKKILVLAFLIRVILLPFSYHSDLTTNAIWGIYAKEFGLMGYYDWLNFGNYAIPEYPPFSTLLFLFIRFFWGVVFSLLWKINISISLFPSQVIPWFEKSGYLLMFKLPGVIFDLMIGIFLYKWLIEKYKNKTRARLLSAFYLFNPAVIYLSSSWGQTESVVGFFALFSFYLMTGKKFVASFVSLFVSLMFKATMAPIGLLLFIKSLKNREFFAGFIKTFLLIATLMILIGRIFSEGNGLVWLLDKYRNIFLIGANNLLYLNLNAFNFWGLIVGFERTAYANWIYLIGLVAIVPILIRYKRDGDDAFAALLVSYSVFMLFPRMHERYFYPVFIFFPLVLAKRFELKKYFVIASTIFLANLYHWWWFPFINPLVVFLDLEIVERGLSLVNLVVFFVLYRAYFGLSLRSTLKVGERSL